MWKKKQPIETDNIPNKQAAHRCSICGLANIEYIDNGFSYHERARDIRSFYNRTVKTNYLLLCPNCEKYYCIKHEFMILREINKCHCCKNEEL